MKHDFPDVVPRPHARDGGGRRPYAGRQNLDPALLMTRSGLLRPRSRLLNDAKQFYVKLSCLVRFLGAFGKQRVREDLGLAPVSPL